MSPGMFDAYCRARKDVWMPACGGTETPIRARSGAWLIYCFNPSLDQHAYLCNDIVLTNEEAEAHLQRN